MTLSFPTVGRSLGFDVARDSMRARWDHAPHQRLPNPFLALDGAKRSPEGSCRALDLFLALSHPLPKECAVRIGSATVALLGENEQLRILNQIVEMADAPGCDVLTCPVLNNAMQQLMHEATQSILLRSVVHEYMSTTRVPLLASHPDALFQVLSYVHLLGTTNDADNSARLCRCLQISPGSGFAKPLLRHDKGYKVMCGLARLQPVSTEVADLMLGLLQSVGFATVADHKYGNYVVSEVLVFGPETTRQKFVDALIHNMKAFLDSPFAYFCVQRWLQVTEGFGFEEFKREWNKFEFDPETEYHRRKHVRDQFDAASSRLATFRRRLAAWQ